MTRTIRYVAALSMSLLMLSCAPGAEDQGIRPGGEEARGLRLVIGTVKEIASINYFDRGFSGFGWILTHHGLVRFDKEGGIIPALAESWDTSDLERWVFHLRKDALWHDGVKVTSEDIVYTVAFERKHDPAARGAIYGDVVSVEAPDPHTVVFELENADYNFLTTIAVMTPVPAHVFKQVEDPKRYEEKAALLGTGPYAFESFDKEAGRVKFTAFDGYWGGRPAIDTLEIRLFKNPETMMMAFRKGEIDLPYAYARGVSYYHVPSLLKNPDIDHMVARGCGLGNVLWINNSRRPLNERVFRQALGWAIDYRRLVDLFTAGYGAVPPAGFVVEGAKDYVVTRKMAFDLERSKAILDDAGFRDLDGDGLREAPDGSPIMLTMVLCGEPSDQVRLGEMLKEYLADAGVGVTLRSVDSGLFMTIMDVDKTFDLAVQGTTTWGMNMGVGYGSGYVDARYYGWSMVSAPEFLALMDELKIARDLERRKELAAGIQHYYADEMTQIPLYTMDIIQPYSRKYEGWAYSTYYGVICPETFYNLHPAR